MRKIALCILGTLTINCGPKVDGDRDSRGGTGIGPAGGVVEGPNGARIEIPEGALDEEVEIGIRLANSADLEGINWSALETTVDDRFVSAEVSSFSFFQPGASAPEEDDGVEEAGDAYEVTPHGQGFQRPVRVRVPYRNRVAGLGLFRDTGRSEVVEDREGEAEGEEGEGEEEIEDDLMWQDPPHTETMTYDQASAYCMLLEINEFSDWRLPIIDELRALIRGCPSTEIDGPCPARHRTSLSDSRDPNCAGCTADNGPSPDGCYWSSNLHGDCDLRYLSSSGQFSATCGSRCCGPGCEKQGLESHCGCTASVNFRNGRIETNGSPRWSSYGVRCVRDNP